MAALKILFLLAAAKVVQPKPFLFNEVKMKKNFEFSLKPVLKPLTFIKEWTPLVPVKINHAISKRSSSPPAPVNPEPSPAPLFKIDLEKSIEINPLLPPPPPHPRKEQEINKPPHVGPSTGHPRIHEEIHVEHFHDTPKPPPVGKLLTRVDIRPSPVLPSESYENHLPPHVRLAPVSPIPPPHAVAEEYLRGPRLSVSPPPPLGPHIPQVTVGHKHHLLVEPKQKVTGKPEIVHESQETLFFEVPKSTSVIHGHPPPPPPPHLAKVTPLPPGNEKQGTLEVFFAPPPAGIQEEPVPPHHRQPLPQQVTGQGSFPVPEFVLPPPAGIQESNKPLRSPLLTDISRADEISAYLKAIDALPLVKPPLEENVLLAVPGNSVELVGPKNTVENKADESTLTRGSRLALYFGNILLQVMSQAIGSARSAIGQYSMPKMF